MGDQRRRERRGTLLRHLFPPINASITRRNPNPREEREVGGGGGGCEGFGGNGKKRWSGELRAENGDDLRLAKMPLQNRKLFFFFWGENVHTPP